MRQYMSLVNTFACCLILLILAGCGFQQRSTSSAAHTGATVPVSTPVSTTSSVHPTPVPTANPVLSAKSVTPAPTPALPVPTPTPVVTTGTPAITGNITLALNKTHYSTNDTIVVTLVNGLATNISATDHQSGCTMITLQEQSSNGAWQDQDVCREGIATRIVMLQAGYSYTLNLAPTTGTFARNVSWPQGTYRIAFSFTTAHLEAANALIAGLFLSNPIYSNTFTIA